VPAAKCAALVRVTAGTTLGMMIADVPAVLLGERAVRFVPIAWVHRIAAAVFALLGVLVLAGMGTQVPWAARRRRERTPPRPVAGHRTQSGT
jgi:putative Ca2+/H+ antiporter (TMEM165/GDT1 family)